MSKSTLTRRALVASTAAMPAAAALGLPVAQAAAEPDPIFAAIEAHRKAREEFAARNAYADKLEGEWFKQRSSSADRDEARDAASEVELRASEKTDDVASILASVEPTTIAGVCALLTYYADVEVIDLGAHWPYNLQDDDDTAVVRHGGASVGYFVARAAGRALAKIASAQS